MRSACLSRYGCQLMTLQAAALATPVRTTPSIYWLARHLTLTPPEQWTYNEVLYTTPCYANHSRLALCIMCRV